MGCGMAMLMVASYNSAQIFLDLKSAGAIIAESAPLLFPMKATRPHVSLVTFKQGSYVCPIYLAWFWV